MNTKTEKQTSVPRQFKALCNQILRQEVTYAEAWDAVQDIVLASVRGIDGGIPDDDARVGFSEPGRFGMHLV